MLSIIATWIADTWKDVIFAARRLVRSPAFTLASVLTLALAIGANASIFAVVQRVVLNPLPYPDSDRLIDVDHGAQRLNLPSGMGMPRGLYYQYLNRAHTLDGVALYPTDDLTLTGDGDPERIRVDARDDDARAGDARVAGAGPLVHGGGGRAGRAARAPCCRTGSGSADTAATRAFSAARSRWRRAGGSRRRDAGLVCVPRSTHRCVDRRAR